MSMNQLSPMSWNDPLPMSLLAHDDSAGMPWKESSAMKERVKFVLEWESR